MKREILNAFLLNDYGASFKAYVHRVAHCLLFVCLFALTPLELYASNVMKVAYYVHVHDLAGPTEGPLAQRVKVEGVPRSIRDLVRLQLAELLPLEFDTLGRKRSQQIRRARYTPLIKLEEWDKDKLRMPELDVRISDFRPHEALLGAYVSGSKGNVRRYLKNNGFAGLILLSFAFTKDNEWVVKWGAADLRVTPARIVTRQLRSEFNSVPLLLQQVEDIPRTVACSLMHDFVEQPQKVIVTGCFRTSSAFTTAEDRTRLDKQFASTFPGALRSALRKRPELSPHEVITVWRLYYSRDVCVFRPPPPNEVMHRLCADCVISGDVTISKGEGDQRTFTLDIFYLSRTASEPEHFYVAESLEEFDSRSLYDLIAVPIVSTHLREVGILDQQ